jgi:hypothetical protein
VTAATLKRNAVTVYPEVQGNVAVAPVRPNEGPLAGAVWYGATGKVIASARTSTQGKLELRRIAAVNASRSRPIAPRAGRPLPPVRHRGARRPHARSAAGGRRQRQRPQLLADPVHPVGHRPGRSRSLQDRDYRWCTYAFLPLQYAGLVFACALWASGQLTVADKMGLVGCLPTTAPRACCRLTPASGPN